MLPGVSHQDQNLMEDPRPCKAAFGRAWFVQKHNFLKVIAVVDDLKMEFGNSLPVRSRVAACFEL
jgi:hypothetical protein